MMHASRENEGRRRSGFTLAEVLVVITILSILAAMTIPTVQSRINVSRGTAVAKELSSLTGSLQGFRTNVGLYPRFLSYLTTMPGAGAETYCSTGALGTLVTFTPTQTAKWRGPYISRLVTGDYTVVSNATIVNQMTYFAGPPAYLRIVVNSIDPAVADAAEEVIDGPVVTGSYTSGSFTWDGVNGAYRIPVPTCP